MSNLHIIDITIVAVYIIVCILIGLYRYKSVKTLKEYALGTGRFPSIVIITTFLMTAFGATQVVGCIAEVYALGVFFAIVCLFVPMTWLIMAVIYSRSIEQFRGCISLSDIMEMLYGKVGRCVTNIASLLISIGVVVMQMTAVGYIINYLLGISYTYSIIISGSCIQYVD